MNLRKFFNILIFLGALLPLATSVLVGGWVYPFLEAQMSQVAAMLLGGAIGFIVLIVGGLLEAAVFIAVGPHPRKTTRTAPLDGIRLDDPEVAMDAY